MNTTQLTTLYDAVNRSIKECKIIVTDIPIPVNIGNIIEEHLRYCTLGTHDGFLTVTPPIDVDEL